MTPRSTGARSAPERTRASAEHRRRPLARAHGAYTRTPRFEKGPA